MATVHIGTSGFYYPHWIGDFYPQNLPKNKLLSYYVKFFDTVEINSSFYHLPKEETVKNWKKISSADFIPLLRKPRPSMGEDEAGKEEAETPRETPPFHGQRGFIFSFKISRFISHIKRLNPDKKAVDLFFNRLKSFENTKNKHLILIQTPSNLKINSSRLMSFITFLPKTFLYAFEFRHQSWFTNEIYEILQQNNCAVVLSDSPKDEDNTRLWPYENIDTADFFYIRFHGSQSLYSSSYTNKELKFYAKLIKEKQQNGQAVYAYFNNDAAGFAIENAKKLKNLLKTSGLSRLEV